MPQASIAVVAAIGGQTINQTVTKTANHANCYGNPDINAADAIVLPAAKAGTLGTRTSDVAGTITANAHGLIVGDIVDIYWAAGRRANVRVDTVPNAADFTFDDTPTATGDVLPAQDTAVTVSKQTVINTAIDGDAVAAYAMTLSQRGRLEMRDVAAVVIKAFDFATANAVEPWYAGSNVANPLTGNPITASVASNAATAPANLVILAIDDATP